MNDFNPLQCIFCLIRGDACCCVSVDFYTPAVKLLLDDFDNKKN